jgi:hypothetical protein
MGLHRSIANVLLDVEPTKLLLLPPKAIGVDPSVIDTTCARIN